MPFAVGGRIGRYDLLEHLGEGGQGSVWRVRDVVPPHHERALKIVSRKSLSGAALERLRREADLLQRLHHPALVRCHGLFESYEEDVVGVELDFANGPNLLTLVEAGDARFDVFHRHAALRHIAEALAYLHGNALVHRDVKLENVIVTNAFWSDPAAPGSVRLVDFGISAQIGNPQKLTDVGRVIGTMPYMAPETIDPSHWPATPTSASPTVDVFAFGVLGWILLRGQHPTGLPMNASPVDFAVRYRAIDANGAPWSLESGRDRWDLALRQCVAPRASHRIADGGGILRAVDGVTAPMTAGVVHTSTAAPTAAHRHPVTEPGDPPPPEALRASLPPRSSMPISARALGEPPRTSSPLLRDVPASAPRAEAKPDRFPVFVVVALAGIAGAVVAAFGADRYLLASPEPLPVPRGDDGVVPPPVTVATAGPMMQAPPAPACTCKGAPACGTEWKRGTPGACTDPIPQGDYWLRLSFLGVRMASREDASSISLWDAEEDAEVCLRVTGASDQEEVCVRKPQGQDACSMNKRLRVPLSSVTGNGPGLDVVVRRGDIDLAKRHIEPYDAGSKQQSLCTGFVAGKEGWSRDPRWRWAPAKIGFFLDPP